ncbi:MAG TPA: CaiB/BaiF CoA-transferase family protein [Ktedonobacterales bacterium]|jgi:crotonobetainyl-CoA:carnitine CoA-transferase CaiB-like acyl-CoA transferase|nr:CaiB/BaiF CoA-transferase family protein [Ktedonobacterales bacterium]
MNGPLDGITVVALEQAVAAPFASRQLADLGARVIKIERPLVGDFARGYDETVRGMSSHFVWLNRSKESLTLDVKQVEGAEILRRLVADADVFIHNLAPGAVDRLGFGAARLRAAHPRLIVCGISGYGTSGPYRDKKAYDLLAQCEAGLVSITGSPSEPAKVGVSVADIAAGVYAYSGVLTALYQRERTGEGTSLDVSLFDALGEWMGYPAYFTAYGGTPPPRAGASHATIAPYGPFTASDGLQINLGVQNEREWRAFCAVALEQPALADDPRFATNSLRVANRSALHTLIDEAFATITSDALVERLERAQIAYARMNDMMSFWNHPQLRERARWRSVGSPVGDLQALVPPVGMEGMESRMDPIPDVGEHTDAILRALGYADARIKALRAARVI